MYREKVEVLRRVYDAFNRRDIDAALKDMHPEVEWPNVLQGTTIRKHEAIRDYWTKQFELIESRVEPEEFIETDNHVVVLVHQVVHDKGGALLADQHVAHAYAFRDREVARMDVYESRNEALEAVAGPGA